MSLNLKSIGEELADCRLAMAGARVGDAVLHCHHGDGVLVEFLTELPGTRILTILVKPVKEQPLRLRKFRLWRGTLTPEFSGAWRAYQEARWPFTSGPLRAYQEAARVFFALPQTIVDHAAQCPDCPWDGTTLFP